MVGVLVEMIICGILACVIVNVIRHIKLMNIYILKKVCIKRLFGKLVLECEDEILNTTESSLDDKKVTCGKSNFLIHTISLVIICLLIRVNCYFCRTKYQSKQKTSPFHFTNNKIRN